MCAGVWQVLVVRRKKGSEERGFNLQDLVQHKAAPLGDLGTWPWLRPIITPHPPCCCFTSLNHALSYQAAPPARWDTKVPGPIEEQ